MKVLLLGSGGRESSLAWALSRSRSVTELCSAPGNPGMAAVGDVAPVSVDDPAEVVALAEQVRPDLVVIGPEAPLVAGVGNALRAAGFKAFGPDAAAARIEGSKAHAKDLMSAAGIPTAAAEVCSDVAAATAALDRLGPPFVVKADGLAAGKGVVVTGSRSEADRAVRACLLEGRFGGAGSTVVIEEFLDGEEASLIAFSDGATVLACEPAQDYKRAEDGDAGPNTGGMGSYSPVPSCPPDLAELIAKEVLEPMVAVTADRGAPFIGALYAGLALTSKGPRVIEFNARFGDPETQALLPRLRSDLGETCLAAASGDLEGVTLSWDERACVSVVLASGGYPGAHENGFAISGVRDASRLDGVEVFHAGTAESDGSLVTAGGRVLAVSALGEDLASARDLAYSAAELIDFEGKHFRTDIASRATQI